MAEPAEAQASRAFGKTLLAFILFVAAGGGACGAWLARSRGGNGVNFACAEAFAGGALLAAGLLHLLPDAAEDLAPSAGGNEEEEEGFPWAQLLCGLGCLLTHGAEAIAEALWQRTLDQRTEIRMGRKSSDAVVDTSSATRMGRGDSDGSGNSLPEELEQKPVLGGSSSPTPCSPTPRPRNVTAIRSTVFGSLLMVALSIHSVLEGLSLGASNQARAVDLFVAILCHKGVAAFSLGVAWLSITPSRQQYAKAMLWFACATPIGVAVGHPVEGSKLGAIATALSSGTFLYVGLVETCPGIRATWLSTALGVALQVSSYAIGFTSMAILALYT